MFFEALISVRMFRIRAFGVTRNEVTALDAPGEREIPIEILSAPDHIEVGVPLTMRVQLPARANFGPGSLTVGEGGWLKRDPNDPRPLGVITFISIAPIGVPVEDKSEMIAAWRSVLPASASDGDVHCPRCGVVFSIADRWRWTGTRHSTCGQKLLLSGFEEEVWPVWSVVANVVRSHSFGPGGLQRVSGTKLFRGGSRVVCFPSEWGDGGEHIRVVGHHRHSRKLVACTVRASYLENFRVKLCYDPAIVDRISGFWTSSELDRAKATELAARLPAWQATPSALRNEDTTT